ncbi:MAG: diadenylate cyclase CdaA [Treponemataceae bacterium]|nr:diadenylate cyclase CdaA [Treponemataceae bacterium]
MNNLDKLLEIYKAIKPFLDVALMTFLLYKCYQLVMRTQGLKIIRALVIFASIYVISIVLHLDTVLWLLNMLAPGIIVGFAIVFQPELRKIILKLGQGDWFKSGNRAKDNYIDSILIAAEMLSKQKRGMLVAFIRTNSLKEQIETGTPLNADLSSSLLVTIFGHDTPMHDGAVVVQGGKLIAAGCFLPLSENFDIKKTFGTRHRAALGLSEETDAIVLVVSEESGAISLAYEGNLYYDLSHDQIVEDLQRYLKISTTDVITEEFENEN